jgi:hypothetical protein
MNKHHFATGAVVVMALGGGLDLSVTRQSQSILQSSGTVAQRLDAVKLAVLNESLTLAGNRKSLLRLAGDTTQFADK